MSSNLIFRLLYGVIHIIFTTLQWISENFIDGVVDFCHEFCLKRRTSYLQNEIQSRKKVPTHLTVLLGRETPSYKDIANIVVWCMLNHINFLSFYDHKEILCKHKIEKELNGKLHQSDHIFLHDSPGSNHKNGFIGRKIHIKILKYQDGRSGLVKLTKALSKTSKKVEFSVETLDAAVYEEFDFPNPDLGLCCGKNLNLFAYPPWQMRLTEFLSIKSHHRLSYRIFLEQLFIYSKCEQREGK